MYTYPQPGIKDDYRQIISQPIDDKVFFCGEAHHPVYWSTIHGAMETGLTVAESIKSL